MTTTETIRDYIRSNFMFGSDQKIGDADSLLDAGIIDSTGAMELVSFLEDQFGLTVADQDLVPENLDSITALTSYVTRKLAENGSARTEPAAARL